MVGETVLRTTFMSMAMCRDLDAAMLHAINSITFNAMHLSLLPVLMERCVCVCVCRLAHSRSDLSTSVSQS